ncbi:MAG: FtsX-like permease family protein [Bacteroidales bacterium]
MHMTLHNLKISIRNILRQKFYTLINILGFGLGITVFAFVGIYVVDQNLYDRWVDDRHQIFRLEADDWAIQGSFQGPFLAERIPEIETFCRVDMYWLDDADFTIAERVVPVSEVIMADSTFFDLFPVQFIAGHPGKALSDPRSIVLTRKQAVILYGTTDVVGQTLLFRNNITLQVTGVIEDPRYFHIPLNGIVPFPLLAELWNDPGALNTFGGWNYFTFFRLHPDADIMETEARINKVIQDYFLDFSGEPFPLKYHLRPLSDIFFADDLVHEPPVRHGSHRSVRAFTLLALIVLAIAVINFINLSTARAANRSKEVGVRKLLGSTRKKLIGQFLFESVLTTGLAVLLAMIFIEIFLPHFNSLAGTVFNTRDIGAGTLLLLLLTSVLLVGFLSGIYPAIYLTAFQPISTLKGEKTRGRKGVFFRKALIVFQFSVSIALIASTILVYKQVNYMKSQDLGFEKENIIYFQGPPNSRKEAFKNAILEHPDVIQLSYSNASPGSISWQESTTINGVRKQYTFLPAHHDYLELLGIDVIAGRHFDPGLRSEHQQVIIINESAIPFFELQGSHEDVIGQEINGRRIIGIIPDFHFNSLQQLIGPFVVCWDEPRSQRVSIKNTGKDIPGLMSFLEEVYYSFVPDRFFRPYFLDREFDRNYQEEERFGAIILLFSGFSIFIACLGLFGLASFMAEQRSREIAVRKVLGAGTLRITLMLLKDFYILVGIGFLVGAPLAWYFMDRWLSSFPYKLDMKLLPLVVGGLVAVIITTLSVSYHAIRVSLANPSDALKYE